MEQSSSGSGGLRFLSPNSILVSNNGVAIGSGSAGVNNQQFSTLLQIRNELFKLVNQVSSSFGPNGKFKLLVTSMQPSSSEASDLSSPTNQSQIITKSGSQILECIKTNNPIVQYLISLFINNNNHHQNRSDSSSEYCDGKISCLLLTFELLDLICGSEQLLVTSNNNSGSNNNNINVICSHLHQIMNKMFNNHDEIIQDLNTLVVQNHYHNHNDDGGGMSNKNSSSNNESIDHSSSVKLSTFIKSLISIQIEQNSGSSGSGSGSTNHNHLNHLLYEWFKFASNDFSNLHLISEHNLQISKSLGRIDDSKLVNHSLTLYSLQNLNTSTSTISSSGGIETNSNNQMKKICCISSTTTNNSIGSDSSYQSIAMKINCDIMIIVGNNGKQHSANAGVGVLNRRFIQCLNERGISVYFYSILNNTTTTANNGNNNNMELLLKLVDVLQMTGIATSVNDLIEDNSNNNNNYKFGLSNVKISYKNNGQQCDLTFTTSPIVKNGSSDGGSGGYSTLYLKSQSQEMLNQVEYQIIKCIRHVKQVVIERGGGGENDNNNLLAIIGGGSFECYLSNSIKKQLAVKMEEEKEETTEDPLYGIVLNIISKSLLSIPKMLLYNSLSQQNNERLFIQLFEDLVKKNNQKQVTFVQQSRSSTIGSSGLTNQHHLVTISRSEIFNQCEQQSDQQNHSTALLLPLESYHARKHVIETAIQIVINILRMDTICFNNN